MKRQMKKIIPILVYLFVIFNFLGFDIYRLIDIKLILLIILSTLILSLSSYNKGMSINLIRKNLSWNAMTAGYLSMFIFVFAGMGKLTSVVELFSEIAMDSRLLLYAFILHIVLDVDELEEIKSDTQTESVIDESQQEAKSIIEEEILEIDKNANVRQINTAQDIYEYFITLGLTKKESEIARLIVSGMTNLEIAEELYIAESTVKKHISHIFEKLEIKSREEVKYILESKSTNSPL